MGEIDPNFLLISQLLQIFVSGNISEYVKFYDAHTDLITSVGEYKHCLVLQE